MKTYLDYLQNVADGDVMMVKLKEETYRGSWKKRGGVGAFMMLARKWDRLENMMERPQTQEYMDVTRAPDRYDIFGGIAANPTDDDGTVLAEVRDLRRYLMLVEAEMMARYATRPSRQDPPSTPGTPEDGGQHGLSNGQG